MKSTAAARQCGHVMVVTLILTLAISLLGIAAMESGLLEVRMAASWRDRNREFHNLELALRHAETDLIPRLPSDDPGPWVFRVELADIAATLPLEGIALPVQVAIQRQPGTATLTRGRGISAAEAIPLGSRYGIEASTLRQDGRRALSLAAIAGYVPGVSP